MMYVFSSVAMFLSQGMHLFSVAGLLLPPADGTVDPNVQTINDFFSNITNYAGQIAQAICGVAFTAEAIKYGFSGSDDRAAAQAKRGMVASLAALVFVFATSAIVGLVKSASGH